MVAVQDFLRVARHVTADDRQALEGAVEAILAGYARGARYGIHVDDDGLLAAGEPGVQLTWMDTSAGDSSASGYMSDASSTASPRRARSRSTRRRMVARSQATSSSLGESAGWNSKVPSAASAKTPSRNKLWK